jgi:hypothetical protein
MVRDARLSSLDGFHKSALSAKYDGLSPRGIPTRLKQFQSASHFTSPRFSLKGGRVVIDLPGDEMVALFEQHLTFLREVRDAVSAHVATSREMIGRSPLIVQIDEQISRMERELGLFGSHARRGPEPETVI